MNGPIDAQALGDLMDGDADGMAESLLLLEQELAKKDDLAARLLKQCRSQHRALAEIHELSADETSTTPLRDLRHIESKARAALSDAARSGLLP